MTQPLDLERMREVAEKALVPFMGGDRPTTEPGGCDCQLCGAIFVGAIQHTTCAGCEAQEEHRRSASPAAVISLLDRIAELDRECDHGLAEIALERQRADAAEAQVSALQAQVDGLREIVPELLAHSISHYGHPKDETFGVGLIHAKARALSQPPADEPAKGGEGL